MEKLTIKDIANLVNVSTATVSNYINGNYSRMSDT
ncbi:LacI family DNA-binding transcriptional regulator, partial [Oenococcus oeni]